MNDISFLWYTSKDSRTTSLANLWDKFRAQTGYQWCWRSGGCRSMIIAGCPLLKADSCAGVNWVESEKKPSRPQLVSLAFWTESIRSSPGSQHTGIWVNQAEDVWSTNDQNSFKTKQSRISTNIEGLQIARISFGVGTGLFNCSTRTSRCTGTPQQSPSQLAVCSLFVVSLCGPKNAVLMSWSEARELVWMFGALKRQGKWA